MKKQARYSLYCLIVFVGLSIYALWRADEEQSIGTLSQAAPALPFPAVSSSLSSTHQAEINRLKQDLQQTSLADTAIDRPLIYAVDGQLVLHGGLLFYFDYFLSLEGEVPLTTIKEWLLRDVKANYDANLTQQVVALFLRYVDYLAEVAEREREVSEEEIIAQNLSAQDMQNAVKAKHFSSAEIKALFGSYDDMLAKPSEASVKQKNYEQFQQVIDENPEQLEAAATELFGAEAAVNLRNVQYKRQQWAGRVAHYQREKQLITQSYKNDEKGQQQAVDLLQQRLFNENEIKRVNALERIEASRRIPK